MTKLKSSVLAMSVSIAFGALGAQHSAWQPSPGHTQIPIWPGTVPNARPVAGAESLTTHTRLVAGRTWSYIQNVSRPTLTVYSAAGKNTGAAVVVFPGGGYQILAIDLGSSTHTRSASSASRPADISSRRSATHFDIARTPSSTRPTG